MLQITGSPDEAEEVVQEAFIRAFTKLDTFQRNSQFFTWLYRIGFNSALTRKRRKRARVSLDQWRENNGLEVSDTGEAVDEPMLRRERIEMVREALRTLSDDHRSILVLREMQEHSYEDIAEILDISIGTVRSRLSRARQQLKVSLEAMQRAEEPKG
jgi:RNA polymerase sigma-70 factor (ECF subfamily)